MKPSPLVARFEDIGIFLAYAAHKDFIVYQMNESAFLNGLLEEEMYIKWMKVKTAFIFDRECFNFFGSPLTKSLLGELGYCPICPTTTQLLTELKHLNGISVLQKKEML